jgi:hypothetical protein
MNKKINDNFKFDEIFEKIYKDYSEIIKSKIECKLLTECENKKDIKDFLKEYNSFIKSQDLIVTDNNKEFIAQQIYLKACKVLNKEDDKHIEEDNKKKRKYIEDKSEISEKNKKKKLTEIREDLKEYINYKKDCDITDISVGDNYGCIVEYYEQNSEMVIIYDDQKYDDDLNIKNKKKYYYWKIAEKEIDDNDKEKITYF